MTRKCDRIRLRFGRVLVGLPIILCVLVCVGCGGSSPVEPGEETSALESPTSGIARQIEGMVALTLAGDADGLLEQAEFQQVPCVAVAELGSPPPCRDAESPGTPVEALPIVQCDGGLVRRDEAGEAIGRMLSRAAFELYAAYALIPVDERSRDGITFRYLDDLSGHAFTINLADGLISSVVGYCDTSWEANLQAGVDHYWVPPRTSDRE
jgi:hypothetical protein